jgi:archaellum component FlaC|tara:strand:+ start:2667 stop:2903 length:237 start_codon:yes stop_codon:yes gene_type:complete
MRIIKNLYKEEINITLFDFGLKYVVKFEKSGMEQTFKLDKLEIGEVENLENSIDEELIKSITSRFNEMSNEFNKFYKF